VVFPRPLRRVTLLRRVNRFVVEALTGGRRRVYLHLPNSGRMDELLRPGTAGLAHRPGARGARTGGLRPGGARTGGTLLLLRHRGRWVGVDAHLPNRLFAAATRRQALAPFRGYTVRRREVGWQGQRIDFLLAGPRGACLVETKSCNRVEGDVALFPDAATARGARHLRVLAAAARAGWRAAVVWFVQRDDARRLRLDPRADPALHRAALAARAAGVRLYAYACRMTPGRATVGPRIPVTMDRVRPSPGSRTRG